MSCNCIGASGLSISNYLKWADQCPHPGQPDVGCERKKKLLERAAGVAESSGRIQVSVKPKMLRVDCKEKAEIKSALLTADWQFQRAIEKERGVVEDVEMGRRLAGLLCRLRVMLERGRETTGMVLKHMIEDSKGECDRNDT